MGYGPEENYVEYDDTDNGRTLHHMRYPGEKKRREIVPALKTTRLVEEGDGLVSSGTKAHGNTPNAGR